MSSNKKSAGYGRFLNMADKKFKSMDLFGSKLELNIEGSSTFNTRFGAVISLVGIGFLIWFMIRTVERVFDVSNPTVFQTSTSNLGDAKFNLKDSELLPTFVFLNRSTNTPIPAIYHSLFTTQVAEFIYTSNNLVTSTIDTNKIQYFVKPCLEITNRKPYERYFSDSTFVAAAFLFSCIELPENTDFLIYGDRISTSMGRLALQSYPCSLPNPLMCLPSAAFVQFEMGVITFRKYIQYSDFKDPIKAHLVPKESLNFIEAIGTIVTTQINKVTLEDNTNLALKQSENREYLNIVSEQVTSTSRPLQTYCTVAEISSYVCSPYVTIEYRVSSVFYKFQRTYTDLMSAFSDIGGFKELVFIVAIAVYIIYNNIVLGKTLERTILDAESIQGFVHSSSINQVGPSPHHKYGKVAILDPRVDQINGLQNGEDQVEIEEINENGGLNQNQKMDAKKKDNMIDKKRASKKMQEIKEDISDLVDENTSIVTLMKEINNWRLLKDIIFLPYQLELLPLVAIEKIRRKKDSMRDNYQQEESVFLENGIAKSIKELFESPIISLNYSKEKEFEGEAVEKIGIEKPIENLAEEWPESTGRPLDNRQTIDFRALIDKYLVENLPGYILDPASCLTKQGSHASNMNMSPKPGPTNQKEGQQRFSKSSIAPQKLMMKKRIDIKNN